MLNQDRRIAGVVAAPVFLPGADFHNAPEATDTSRTPCAGATRSATFSCPVASPGSQETLTPFGGVVTLVPACQTASRTYLTTIVSHQRRPSLAPAKSPVDESAESEAQGTIRSEAQWGQRIHRLLRR